MQNVSERMSTRPRHPTTGGAGPWTLETRRLLCGATLGVGLSLLSLCRGAATRPDDFRPIPELVVDVNAAPADLFSALPGVGPKLAARIVEARRERLFDSLDDLDRRIRGIGPATMARLAPHLRIEPAAEGSVDHSERPIASRGD